VTLVVCATPIGNLEDVTLRVLRELGEAGLVLCEDTRRTRILLDRHGIDYAILSCGSTLGIGNLPDIDVAADVASATNDWTIDEWFPV